jgi:hypothetical protein
MISGESGGAIAYFPSTDQIHPGQRALVTIASDSIPARVQTVARDHAELVFTNNQPQTTNNQPSSASVEIFRISPTAIAFHNLRRAHQ